VFVDESPAQGFAYGAAPAQSPVRLTAFDQAFLDGTHGLAAQAAMRIIVRMAGILGAEDLVDVTQGHIDGCVYTGPSSLVFAEKLVAWGATVRVPTTMNSISVDKRRWRAQGIDPALGEPAVALADAYLAMGVQPSFTCAPYLLDSAPGPGEQIVWAESNAVIFANSVLGARTMKYPDYLDIAIALTGRAPLAGCHIAGQRLATIVIEVPGFEAVDDSFYPLLGYHMGALAGSAIPVVTGLAQLAPGRDALKAFSAAFATTSSAPMFHMLGVTPEAGTLAEATGATAPIRTIRVTAEALLQSWRELNSATDPAVDVIALGNPHFSYTKCLALAELCQGRRKDDGVAVIVTCGRVTHDRLAGEAAIQSLTAFGVQFVTDTCWCMVVEPLIPRTARTIMTDSGKYAHYGPGLVGRRFHFGSLAACVAAACAGRSEGRLPGWLN
jgi:predicted aconitase